jgi:hypothetical protein
MSLSSDLASAYARTALANVTREYPRRLDHLLTGADDEMRPRVLHPSFYGSYDWHSAVHMHWLLARILRTHPALPVATDIRRVLDEHLAVAALRNELGYFQSAAGRAFERPYGWAWLLELQAELQRLGQSAWIEALRPLATVLASRYSAFLERAPHPVRAGTHGNTAFASILALDYARTARDASLVQAIGDAARRWYGADRDAPIAYEPSLDDFLSPALIEALLMREVLPADEFDPWFARFLPHGIGPLATPPIVADRSDAKQSHLDGLSLSRAWCLWRLGGQYQDVAERHLAAGLPQAVGGDYVGEHWLASFAALALGERP